MTQFLPPNLLSLFAPREPIPYLPPLEKLPFEKKTTGYTGIAECINLFEDPKDTPAPVKIETREERLQRKKREKAEKAAYKLEQGIALWDPHNISTATSDPYKTLFVARINYDTSEAKLRREFETYGPIKKVSMVMDKVTGKPRGYAFIEYEHERDMRAAFKHADGKKIDGRRVLVDVERGRTVKGWLPRRLGGGLGGESRKPGYEEGSIVGSHREDSFGASRRADSRERSDSGFRSSDRRERRRSPSDRPPRDHNGSRRRSRSPLSRERRDRSDRNDRDRDRRERRADRPRDLKE